MSPKRVLLAKPGLDGHDRGVRVIARACRDAGFEVIYTGLRATPSAIAGTAIDEDVDVVGLSILSGSHLALTERVVEALEKAGAEDVALLVGGTIPDRDHDRLLGMGVDAVFGNGASIQDIVTFIERLPEATK